MPYFQTSPLSAALTATIDELFIAHPEYFDLAKLTPAQKADVLHNNAKLYVDHIAALKLNQNDKLTILTWSNRTPAIISKKITFSDIELKKLTISQYMKLIKHNFDIYIRADIYNSMTKDKQSAVFEMNPGWVIKTTGVMPKLTQNVLNTIAYKSPKLIEEHCTDFTKISTNSWFWENMIEYDSKYEQIFISNTRSCSTKTDVRTVIKQFPRLIKLLTLDIIDDSKLTGKEWALLIDLVMRQNAKEFVGFKLPDDITEYLDFDLSVSILKGKGSKRLQKATKNLLVKEEPQKNTEDTFLQTDAL